MEGCGLEVSVIIVVLEVIRQVKVCDERFGNSVLPNLFIRGAILFFGSVLAELRENIWGNIWGVTVFLNKQAEVAVGWPYLS